MMNMKMKVTNTRMAILIFLPGINQGKNYTFKKKHMTTIITHIKMTFKIDIMENSVDPKHLLQPKW